MPKKKSGPPDAFSAADDGDVDALSALLAADLTLISKKNKDGWTPLHAAAFAGELECIEALLKAGSDVKAVCKDGDTPLHYSAVQGHHEACRRLVAAGASLSAADNDGETPLDVATDKKTKKVLQELADREDDHGEGGGGAADGGGAAEEEGEDAEEAKGPSAAGASSAAKAAPAAAGGAAGGAGADAAPSIMVQPKSTKTKSKKK